MAQGGIKHVHLWFKPIWAQISVIFVPSESAQAYTHASEIAQNPWAAEALGIWMDYNTVDSSLAPGERSFSLVFTIFF